MLFRSMINRVIESKLLEMATKFPVIAVTGPRQSGKTTLCQKIFKDYKYVSLENPDILQFALSDPRGFLSNYNYKKRTIKSPKIYFYDTGLACHLLGIRTKEEINVHFANGQLFENYIINK